MLCRGGSTSPSLVNLKVITIFKLPQKTKTRLRSYSLGAHFPTWLYTFQIMQCSRYILVSSLILRTNTHLSTTPDGHHFNAPCNQGLCKHGECCGGFESMIARVVFIIGELRLSQHFIFNNCPQNLYLSI
jgi:hypothetical protein